jgi:putative restriction endonuclease
MSQTPFVSPATRFDAALSIRTRFTRPGQTPPYEDAEGSDGYLRYKWRRTEFEQHDNVALRRALEQEKPLIWFFGVASGVYTPICPVWLVGEEVGERQFIVAVTADMRDQWHSQSVSHPVDLAMRRQYAHTLVRQRLHQKVFRERVLLAYGSRCTLCRLQHPELLDAAHIREDADGGEPVVTNGLAMCAIHHRAFDKRVIGIRSDHIVEVRKDVRLESDGPTLQHALQSLHGSQMTKPRNRRAWPDPLLLDERYERFREAG